MKEKELLQQIARLELANSELRLGQEPYTADANYVVFPSPHPTFWTGTPYNTKTTWTGIGTE